MLCLRIMPKSAILLRLKVVLISLDQYHQIGYRFVFLFLSIRIEVLVSLTSWLIKFENKATLLVY